MAGAGRLTVGGALSPDVATVRNAVHESLAGLAPGELVLAACSGGQDSLALAAALAFTAPRAGLAAGAVTVDHGLQDGSAERARAVAATLRGLGLDPVHAVAVTVDGPGGPGGAAPWIGPAVAGGQAAAPWPVRPSAARRAPAGHRRRVRGAGTVRLVGPAQCRPPLRPGQGPARRAARA